MKTDLWPWFQDLCFRRPQRAVEEAYHGLVDLLRVSAPDTPRVLRRIGIMELTVILPIKFAGIAMLFAFYLRPWVVNVNKHLDIEENVSRAFFWAYIVASLIVAGLLFRKERLPLWLVQWLVFISSLIDGIFVGALTLVTGGYNSILYWLFLGLIVRSAVTVPRATSQLMLNLTLSLCYIISGAVDVFVAQSLDSDERRLIGLSEPPQDPAESLFLRLALLLLMTVCCYGVQALLERQRRIVEEAREFALREGQLRAAGRLAAEFAHMIKNPLAIINNTAFSLERAIKNGKPITEQIRIIQEEVEHSDRIITEIMGYAQLSEGRVEKLEVAEELNHAIERVFPPAAGFPIRLYRSYEPHLPSLVMQRRHLSEAFGNILQNAREAFEGKPGNIFVSARCRDDYSVEVTIRDEGPGVPPDKLGRIFEAYYTTKEKGTGLGLATVKTNVELYGGRVRVESELGKGACFILTFPTKTLMKVAEQT
jgi:signal transduction histidine kinase